MIYDVQNHKILAKTGGVGNSLYPASHFFGRDLLAALMADQAFLPIVPSFTDPGVSKDVIWFKPNGANSLGAELAQGAYSISLDGATWITNPSTAQKKAWGQAYFGSTSAQSQGLPSQGTSPELYWDNLTEGAYRLTLVGRGTTNNPSQEGSVILLRPRVNGVVQSGVFGETTDYNNPTQLYVDYAVFYSQNANPGESATQGKKATSSVFGYLTPPDLRVYKVNVSIQNGVMLIQGIATMTHNNVFTGPVYSTATSIGGINGLQINASVGQTFTHRHPYSAFSATNTRVSTHGWTLSKAMLEVGYD